MAAAMRPNRPDDAGPGDPLPAWKRWLFMGITLAIPLVALAVAEAGLRLGGWGGYPAFFRIAGQLPSGASVALVEPAATKPYFFANPTRPGYAEETNFLMPKPADTVRIFLVGESAAKGYPQPRNLSMAAFLKAMLADAWPEKNVEVISLGTTAVASFPLVYLTREAVRYQPDLVVFYVGNNEFFGAYGVASINSFGTLPTWALPWMRAVRGLVYGRDLRIVLDREHRVDQPLEPDLHEAPTREQGGRARTTTRSAPAWRHDARQRERPHKPERELHTLHTRSAATSRRSTTSHAMRGRRASR